MYKFYKIFLGSKGTKETYCFSLFTGNLKNISKEIPSLQEFRDKSKNSMYKNLFFSVL